MSIRTSTSEKVSVTESNCRQIIDFLARNHYNHAVSLYTLTQPDLHTFWLITNFTFKQLDPNLSVSNLKELNDILRALNSPYQTIKAATDEKSWEKLIKIISWVCKIISAPVNLKINHYTEFSFEAYENHVKGNQIEGVIDEYLSRLPTFIESDKEKLESKKQEIEILNMKKELLQNSLVDDRLTIKNEEMYLEVEKLTEIEADYKFLYKYNQILWDVIRKRLGGRNLNSDFLTIFKQEQQEIHSNCISKISEIVEIEGIIQSLNEKVSKSEASCCKEFFYLIINKEVKV